jgi:hypothetical protein
MANVDMRLEADVRVPFADGPQASLIFLAG